MTTGATWRLLQNIWPWILESTTKWGPYIGKFNSNPPPSQWWNVAASSRTLWASKGFKRHRKLRNWNAETSACASALSHLIGLCLKPWGFPRFVAVSVKTEISMEMCRIDLESSFFQKINPFFRTQKLNLHWLFLYSSVQTYHLSFIYLYIITKCRNPYEHANHE